MYQLTYSDQLPCAQWGQYYLKSLDLNNSFSFDSKQKGNFKYILDSKPRGSVWHDYLQLKAKVDWLLKTEKLSGRKWKTPSRHSRVFTFLYSPYLPIFLAPILIIWYVTFLDKMCSLKVHIFREGHKILQNLHPLFVLCTASQIIGGDFAKSCGLLRVYEL